ncbi:MAG: hypothetical protein ACYDCC_02225 [Actinomycetota bacterium]
MRNRTRAVGLILSMSTLFVLFAAMASPAHAGYASAGGTTQGPYVKIVNPLRGDQVTDNAMNGALTPLDVNVAICDPLDDAARVNSMEAWVAPSGPTAITGGPGTWTKVGVTNVKVRPVGASTMPAGVSGGTSQTLGCSFAGGFSYGLWSWVKMTINVNLSGYADGSMFAVSVDVCGDNSPPYFDQTQSAPTAFSGNPNCTLSAASGFGWAPGAINAGFDFIPGITVRRLGPGANPVPSIRMNPVLGDSVQVSGATSAYSGILRWTSSPNAIAAALIVCPDSIATPNADGVNPIGPGIGSAFGGAVTGTGDPADSAPWTAPGNFGLPAGCQWAPLTVIAATSTSKTWEISQTVPGSNATPGINIVAPNHYMFRAAASTCTSTACNPGYVAGLGGVDVGTFPNTTSFEGNYLEARTGAEDPANATLTAAFNNPAASGTHSCVGPGGATSYTTPVMSYTVAIPPFAGLTSANTYGPRILACLNNAAGTGLNAQLLHWQEVSFTPTGRVAATRVVHRPGHRPAVINPTGMTPSHGVDTDSYTCIAIFTTGGNCTTPNGSPNRQGNVWDIPTPALAGGRSFETPCIFSACQNRSYTGEFTAVNGQGTAQAVADSNIPGVQVIRVFWDMYGDGVFHTGEPSATVTITYTSTTANFCTVFKAGTVSPDNLTGQSNVSVPGGQSVNIEGTSLDAAGNPAPGNFMVIRLNEVGPTTVGGPGFVLPYNQVSDSHGKIFATIGTSVDMNGQTIEVVLGFDNDHDGSIDEFGGVPEECRMEIHVGGPVTGTAVTISLSTFPHVAVFGRPVTINGHIQLSDGTPISSLSIDIVSHRISESDWSGVGTATSDSNGNFSFTTTPPASSLFKAIFGGNSSLGSAESPAVKFYVRRGVAIHFDVTNLTLGQVAHASVRVLPPAPGERVSLAVLTSSGWVPIATATLPDSSTVHFNIVCNHASSSIYRALYHTQDVDYVWNISISVRVNCS